MGGSLFFSYSSRNNSEIACLLIVLTIIEHVTPVDGKAIICSALFRKCAYARRSFSLSSSESSFNCNSLAVISEKILVTSSKPVTSSATPSSRAVDTLSARETYFHIAKIISLCRSLSSRYCDIIETLFSTIYHSHTWVIISNYLFDTLAHIGHCACSLP